MQVFRGFEHNFQGAVIAVGSFDGVHRGHRYLIREVNRVADENSLSSVIVTFDPHPREVLRADNRLLTTIDERLILLEEAGARNVVVVEFTEEFSRISADVFLAEYLAGRLGAKRLFVGDGHSFGSGGKRQEVENIERAGLMVHYVDRKDSISSTLIRDAISTGQISRASELLASPYLVVTPAWHKSKLLPPSDHQYLCLVDDIEHKLTVDEILSIDSSKRIMVLSECC